MFELYASIFPLTAFKAVFLWNFTLPYFPLTPTLYVGPVAKGTWKPLEIHLWNSDDSNGSNIEIIKIHALLDKTGQKLERPQKKAAVLHIYRIA